MSTGTLFCLGLFVFSVALLLLILFARSRESD